MSDFKVGDRVVIKEYDEISKGSVADLYGDLTLKQGMHFFKGMRYLCGKEFDIEKIIISGDEKIVGVIDGWAIYSEMIMKDEDKPKLTKYETLEKEYNEAKGECKEASKEYEETKLNLNEAKTKFYNSVEKVRELGKELSETSRYNGWHSIGGNQNE